MGRQIVYVENQFQLLFLEKSFGEKPDPVIGYREKLNLDVK